MLSKIEICTRYKMPDGAKLNTHNLNVTNTPHPERGGRGKKTDEPEFAQRDKRPKSGKDRKYSP